MRSEVVKKELAADHSNVISVIRGAIDAEEDAIAQYGKIIGMYEQRDDVTQELIIQIRGDEGFRRREFIGFLKEYRN